MSKIAELAHAIEIGKSKLVAGLVQEALDEGNAPIDILNQGMIDAMANVGEKFKKNEIFVPEMLVAAKAMKKGVEALKPHLSDGNVSKLGKMVMGTVYGDLHDIGNVFLPGEFCGQRSLVDYSPWGHKESDRTERLTYFGFSRYHLHVFK